MTWIIDEQVSALLDGELPAEQESLLLSRLEREPESRAKLARYGLIGELLRDNSAEIEALTISERVAAALDAETSAELTAVRPESSPSAGAVFAGAAIAASIALMVMVNLSEIGGLTHQSGEETTARFTQDHTDVMAVDRARLTRYLMSHSQYANSASRQLFDSHVAMAVNTKARPAWDSHE